jgi:hypothetical protein
MPYCITLRSRTDARITGWYAGRNCLWSTDHNRQSGSTTHGMPVPYAVNCAAYAHATPKSSTSKSPGTTVCLACFCLNLAFRNRASRAIRSRDKDWA